MNSEWFEKVIKEQIKTCEDVLIGKAKEYATDDDRLHNFKNAAGMMSCDPKEALAGMMAKHTISVYDMCRSGKDYPIELWNEKITDHINYLLLLKAVVEEDHWHETLGNEGEKIVKDLKRMIENSTYGLIYKPEEEPVFTAAYGEVPTFDGKPVEIKKPDEKHIQDVIDGLRYCNADTCSLCYRDEEDDAYCIDRLREDAAELLEKYKSIIRKPTSKGKEKTPKIKEDSKDLDKAIHRLRETIEHCTKAECRECDYYLNWIDQKKCSKRVVDEFDNIIIRLKEEHHDNP